jgi:succinate-semialdehyde dehydrogenase/glutarate-semialdehyde dehydrogenase
MIQLADTRLLRTAAYVNGAWIGAEGGKTLEVRNPATAELLGSVPDCAGAETRAAIEAAAAALPAWRARTAAERATLLRRLHGLILASQEDLARLMTAEQGKPLAEARGEIAYAAAFVEWFAEEARRVYGDVIPGHARDRRIVCKPAHQTPLSALALAELSQRAGIPAGVINVVTGSARAIGAELTANPLVRKLSFTGSTEVGKILLQQCAGTVKKVSMELGGNAPFIVFDDADIDAAVAGAIVSKYRNTGQTCVCANRFLVQKPVYEQFAARLAAAVSQLRVGNGLTGETDQGPLIDANAVRKVSAHVADAVARGARILTGGKAHALGGTFFEPTVLGGVTADMLVAREETFGPVAPLFCFSTEAEAIRMANDTEFGLAAYVYTQDLGRSWRVPEALEYGMVGLNTGLISTEVAPFGGIKESGMGREGSRYGLDDYLETKYLCIAGVDPA